MYSKVTIVDLNVIKTVINMLKVYYPQIMCSSILKQFCCIKCSAVQHLTRNLLSSRMWDC